MYKVCHSRKLLVVEGFSQSLSVTLKLSMLIFEPTRLVSQCSRSTFTQLQWPTKVGNYQVMIYKRQSREKAIIGLAADWKEHAAHIRRQLRNRAPRSQSLVRFYIHFLIALGHLIYKTYRGNGFPSLLLQVLPSSLLCTQDFVLIAPTHSIVSASTSNQSNIALQGETQLKQSWEIHIFRNRLILLIPKGKIFVS